MIQRIPYLLAALLISISSLSAQNRAVVATDPLVYGVYYLEVAPASRTIAVAALKQYGEASRNDEGYLSVDLFEQTARPGHFSILEKWADQKSFDAHTMGEPAKQLLTKLNPISLGFDQRPYRTFAVA